MLPWEKSVQSTVVPSESLTEKDLDLLIQILDNRFHVAVKELRDADATKIKEVLDKCLAMRSEKRNA